VLHAPRVRWSAVYIISAAAQFKAPSGKNVIGRSQRRAFPDGMNLQTGNRTGIDIEIFVVWPIGM